MTHSPWTTVCEIIKTSHQCFNVPDVYKAWITLCTSTVSEAFLIIMRVAVIRKTGRRVNRGECAFRAVSVGSSSRSPRPLGTKRHNTCAWGEASVFLWNSPKGRDDTPGIYARRTKGVYHCADTSPSELNNTVQVTSVSIRWSRYTFTLFMLHNLH